jgi:hypothetical protein
VNVTRLGISTKGLGFSINGFEAIGLHNQFYCITLRKIDMAVYAITLFEIPALWQSGET